MSSEICILSREKQVSATVHQSCVVESPTFFRPIASNQQVLPPSSTPSALASLFSSTVSFKLDLSLTSIMVTLMTLRSRSGSKAANPAQQQQQPPRGSSIKVATQKEMVAKFKRASGRDKTPAPSGEEPKQRYLTKHLQVHHLRQPDEIAETLQEIYAVAMDDPANLGTTIQKLHEEYKKNPKKSEQFCFLHAFGQRYHLVHSFTFAPASWQDSDNDHLKSHGGKPLLFTGLETDIGKDLLTLTANLEDLFGFKAKQLASWKACCELTEGFASPIGAGAKTVGAFPFLPIIGKEWCAKVAEGLYPVDLGDTWTPSQLVENLKDYAALCDVNGLVKCNIQNTIRCLVTANPGTATQCQATVTTYEEVKVKLTEDFVAGHLQKMQLPCQPTVDFSAEDPASQNKEQSSNTDKSQEQEHSIDKGDTTLGLEQHHSTDETQTAQEQHSNKGPDGLSAAQRQQLQHQPASTTVGAPTSQRRGNLFDLPPDGRGDADLVEELPDPFTKVPSTVTLAKLTCLRGWTHSTTWQDIDTFWVTLLALCKHDRALWFTNLVRSLREAHPKSFSSKFAYSATFQQHMYDVILTSPQNDVTWWCGIVGGQLALSEEAIAEAHHLDSNFIAFGSQMNLSNNQATAKRTGKCPPVPRSIAALLAFVERVAIFATEFLSRSQLCSYAKQLAKALEEWQHSLAANPQWINLKAGEIIYTLVLIERQEFSRTYLLDDFVGEDGEDIDPAYPNLPSQIPQQPFSLLQNNPCYPPDALPKALRPITVQEPPHNGSGSGGSSTQPPAASNNDSEIRRLRRELERERARNQNKKRKEPSGAGSNPRQASGFQEFFAQLPENKKKGLNVLLQNGGSTPSQTLKTLDLSINTCLRWIVGGRCTFAHCTRQHPDTVPDPEKVKKVVATLTQGANKL